MELSGQYVDWVAAYLSSDLNFILKDLAEPFCGGILMYERMLNKQEEPTIAQMTAYCKDCAELFTRLNEWLSDTFGTAQSVTFPYGNQYGWGIAHRKDKKLICHVFAEENAFTVMMRLSNEQFDSVYRQLRRETKEQIDHKYPCGNGGWLHYRVTCREQFDDIQTLLTVKCT